MVPAGTTFVENSFTVNGSSLPGANPNNGVNIGTVNTGSSLTVTFQVIVTSTPPSNPITNVASIQYAFIVDPASPPVTSTINSNSASTQINNATVTTVLQANRTIVSIGDVITYTATLTNTGNFPANSVLLINAFLREHYLFQIVSRSTEFHFQMQVQLSVFQLVLSHQVILLLLRSNFSLVLFHRKEQLSIKPLQVTRISSIQVNLQLQQHPHLIRLTQLLLMHRYPQLKIQILSYNLLTVQSLTQ